MRSRFVYVDSCHDRGVVMRVKQEELNAEVGAKARFHNVFSTVQRFDDPSRKDSELQWGPVWFEFEHEDVWKARAETIAVINNLTYIFEIPENAIRVWFSGRKSFHVFVEPECLDLEPDKDLHEIIRHWAVWLVNMFDLKTIDPGIYIPRRMMRMPNSVHPQTNLYKIELRVDELRGKSVTEEVLRSCDDIRKMAETPRLIPIRDEADNPMGLSTKAGALWKMFLGIHDDLKALAALSPKEQIRRPPDDPMVPPVCVQHLARIGIPPREDGVFRAIASIASFYRDAGLGLDESRKLAKDWISGLKMISDKAMAAGGIFREIFDNPKTFNFSCNYIRSLGTAKDPIPCLHNLCPWVGGIEQEPKDIVKTSLSASADSALQKIRIQIEARVSGKTATPYVVPKIFKVKCNPIHPICEHCKLARFGGEANFDFGPKDAAILDTINVTRLMKKGNIKSSLGIPKGCEYHHIEFSENQNLEEVRLIPPAQEFGSAEKREYVVRKAYFLGFPITTNKTYRIEGFPCVEPKSQQATLIFRNAEAVESEIEKFEMTDDIRTQLEIFRPGDEQRVEDKINEIHSDLEINVHHIWNRRNLAISYDLVFHSVRGFAFQFYPFVKGWAELIVIGDSGQGKTAMIASLRKHYRMGDMISGGTSRRTGLAYSIQEYNKTWLLVWGVLPQNDLGLLIVDEFSDMSQDDFAMMTDARSSGIIKVHAVVTDETNARVRLIALTNPMKGRPLNGYSFGCEALKELVPGSEDIRRFDFATVVASGEVGLEQLNRTSKPEAPHRYTSHLCNLLLRWTWSRKVEDIKFTEAATRAALEAATDMSKTYVAGEIPLVEPSDQRFKIARLAAACAARLFSSDEEGKALVVLPEHVKYAVDHLKDCYSHPAFRYLEWSQERKARGTPDTQTINEFAAKFMQISNWENVLTVIDEIDEIRSGDLETAGLERENSKEAMYKLRYMKLLERKDKIWRKTPLGLAVINVLAKSLQIKKLEAGNV